MRQDEEQPERLATIVGDQTPQRVNKRYMHIFLHPFGSTEQAGTHYCVPSGKARFSKYWQPQHRDQRYPIVIFESLEQTPTGRPVIKHACVETRNIVLEEELNQRALDKRKLSLLERFCFLQHSFQGNKMLMSLIL